jgi:hypothetical protein
MFIDPVSAQQQTQMYDERQKITVRGQSVVNGIQDKIALALGIETKDSGIVIAKK